MAHGKDYVTPETDRGIASLKHHNLKETTMAKKLFGSLVSMFERKTLSDNDIRTWAKTEYGKDWNFAYHEIKLTGKGPKMGVNN